MEIKKYKKIKDNCYELLIDDSKVVLYDDMIIKHGLILNKNIAKNELDKILLENNDLSAYYKAVKYINIKLRSQKEIIKYLEKYKFSEEIIQKTIIKLEKEGFLNKRLYLTSYINDQLTFTINGPYKIEKQLMELGFTSLEIKPYLEKISNSEWQNRLKKAFDKKLKLNKDGINKFKSKTYYYFQSLGYANEMISEVMESVKVSNSNLKNDYYKVMEKLQKKYEGEKLLLYIKNKLYLKGYSISEINEIISKEKAD